MKSNTMTDNNNNKNYLGDVKDATVSLSQAILAPLDALFKAQIHSARSFLNLLLQVGYPHQPVDGIDNSTGATLVSADQNGPNEPFELEFKYSAPDVNNTTKDYILKIPALALVPINALSIDSGEFKFGLNIKRIDDHEQLQNSRTATEENKNDNTNKRPWYLVSNPISMTGNISSHTSAKQTEQSDTTIDIYIKVSKSPVPAALDNLLTTLTQSAKIIPKQ